MHTARPDSAPATMTPEHPWISLETVPEVEGWMDLQNQELQKIIGETPSHGHGICFSLVHGGEIYLHTNGDGDVLLDVTPEAEWIAPVISASTRTAAPRGQIWLLPQHVLVELILGFSSLVGSSRLVLGHAYRLRK